MYPSSCDGRVTACVWSLLLFPYYHTCCLLQRLTAWIINIHILQWHHIDDWYRRHQCDNLRVMWPIIMVCKFESLRCSFQWVEHWLGATIATKTNCETHGNEGNSHHHRRIPYDATVVTRPFICMMHDGDSNRSSTSVNHNSYNVAVSDT